MIAASGQRAKRLVARARRTNAQRDQTDLLSGFGIPSDGDLFDLVRTAMMAIEAGLECQDWACVAEGYVFLEQALPKLASPRMT